MLLFGNKNIPNTRLSGSRFFDTLLQKLIYFTFPRFFTSPVVNFAHIQFDSSSVNPGVQFEVVDPATEAITPAAALTWPVLSKLRCSHREPNRQANAE